METSAPRPQWNQGSSRLFVTVGAAAILGAGLFSAVTARTATYHSAWLVAYLVLVVGAAQIALGMGQTALAVTPAPASLIAAEFALFLLGNIGVIVGTLASLTLAVDIGSALLVAALLCFALGTRTTRNGWLLWGYRALIFALIASVIVGVILAHASTR